MCGEAADGLEGVEKGRELKPDLIVLDFSMPRLNGLQAAVILHEVLPNTPIILFTFYKGVIPARLAHDAGVALVVSKTDQLLFWLMRLKDSLPGRINRVSVCSRGRADNFAAVMLYGWDQRSTRVRFV